MTLDALMQVPGYRVHGWIKSTRYVLLVNEGGKMKRVYVAGPYNADNICSCLDNMRRGIQASIEVLKAGYAPFCPWLDHHYRLMDGGITREMYQAQGMAWLRVADAMLVLTGHEMSKGTRAEITEAIKLKIPVYYSLDKLREEVKNG